VGFQYLSQVHSGRYADRIQDNIYRSAVGQERHIGCRGDYRNNALVAVASGQFIADRNRSLLCYPYLYPLVNPDRQFGAFFAGEQLYVDDLAPLAVRHSQGSILDLARFFTEDRPQQFFFRRKLGFALGGNLADQYIIGADFGSDSYNTVFIQLAEAFFTDIGNVPGDFLRPQLGIPGFDFVFGYMNGTELILLHHSV
jgi:hypothetical protein